MNQNHLTGKLGEDLALKFLQKKGYNLIRQNYRIPGGEIDLILKKNIPKIMVTMITPKYSFFLVSSVSISVV